MVISTVRSHAFGAFGFSQLLGCGRYKKTLTHGFPNRSPKSGTGNPETCTLMVVAAAITHGLAPNVRGAGAQVHLAQGALRAGTQILKLIL
jgi:hypothetical protein